jgi:catechol 2,3-dioxygenase-like lactoylglutathione lyase family enzyme
MTRSKTEAISPFFIVTNVGQSIAFYRDKLGFETKLREPDRDPFFAIIGRNRAQLFVNDLSIKWRITIDEVERETKFCGEELA